MSYVVLLLAHEGVTQPVAWEAWEALGGRVAVHCPEPFASRPFEGRRLVVGAQPFGRTAWADVSIVFETLRAGVALADQLGDDDAVIALASGDSVPLLPPKETWLAIGKETRVFQRPPIEWIVDNCVFASHPIGEEQWFVARAEHLREAFKVYTNPKALDLVLSRGFKTGNFSPDNFFLRESIGAEVSPRVPPMMYAFSSHRSTVTYTSPVCWESLDGAVSSSCISQVAFTPVPHGECLSLRLCLLYARKRGAAFFRKVSGHDQGVGQFVARILSLEKHDAHLEFVKELARLDEESKASGQHILEREHERHKSKPPAALAVACSVHICGSPLRRLLPLSLRQNPLRIAMLLPFSRKRNKEAVSTVDFS